MTDPKHPFSQNKLNDGHDIFESVGGYDALMRDLLADLTLTNLPTTNTRDDANTMEAAIMALERQKLIASPVLQDITARMPSGPSAGAHVVSHASDLRNQTSLSSFPGGPLEDDIRTNTSPSEREQKQDAWMQSLSSFSALQLTDDFLRADSEKKQLAQQQQFRSRVEGSQIESERNNSRVLQDYDVHEQVLLSSSFNYPNQTFRNTSSSYPTPTPMTSPALGPSIPSRSLPYPAPAPSQASTTTAATVTSTPFQIQNIQPQSNAVFSSQQTLLAPSPMSSMPQSVQQSIHPTHLHPMPIYSSPMLPPNVPPPYHHMTTIPLSSPFEPNTSASQNSIMAASNHVHSPPRTLFQHPILPSNLHHPNILPSSPQMPPTPAPIMMMNMNIHSAPHNPYYRLPQNQTPLTQSSSHKKQHESLPIQTRFTAQDFPSLHQTIEGHSSNQRGDEQGLTQDEAKSYKEEESQVSHEKTQVPSKRNEKNINPPKPRIFFHDTSIHARPIPATLVPSSSMSPRDICYVVHSILKPVLTFSNVLDAYNSDYYRWSFEDRKSRNLFFLPPSHGAPFNTMPMNNKVSSSMLPNPVWKETKIKAKEMENLYEESVEKRATEWSKEKHILGKVTKFDVKRPRAILSSSIIFNSIDTDNKLEEDRSEGEDLALLTEEDEQRQLLWSSRLSIDKGYQAYLNLVELRRLLQTRGKDDLVVMISSTPSEEKEGDDGNSEQGVTNMIATDAKRRRDELLTDVEMNVDKLHSALGFNIEKSSLIQDKTTIKVDEKTLSRTLLLPKGRMLLSRVIDEGILPHASACHLLPVVLRLVLNYSFDTMRSKIIKAAANTALMSAPPAGEDRLLRSLIGLVRTLQPSPHPQNFIDCLDVVNDLVSSEKNNLGTSECDSDGLANLKTLLSHKRSVVELLHIVLSRGSDVCNCNGEIYADEWKRKETVFVSFLTATQ